MSGYTSLGLIIKYRSNSSPGEFVRGVQPGYPTGRFHSQYLPWYQFHAQTTQISPCPIRCRKCHTIHMYSVQTVQFSLFQRASFELYFIIQMIHCDYEAVSTILRQLLALSRCWTAISVEINKPISRGYNPPSFLWVFCICHTMVSLGNNKYNFCR